MKLTTEWRVFFEKILVKLQDGKKEIISETNIHNQRKIADSCLNIMQKLAKHSKIPFGITTNHADAIINELYANNEIDKMRQFNLQVIDEIKKGIIKILKK